MKKMSNLIERQAAIDVCNFFIDLWRGQLGEGISIAIKKRIADLPSAQPEIVRCKDCEYADSYDHCSYVTWWNSADDYCSRAKRRTNG